MNATLHYGPHPSQAGDLFLPAAARARVVCLLHGGFWRMPYGRDQMSPVATDLCRRGFAVWNIGYRRIGQPGVGWEEIGSDVTAAIDFLAELGAAESRLDPHRVAVVGHSAGGQLALAMTSAGRRTGRVRPAAVAALAALTDLEEAFASDIGKGAVRALLGGSPAESRARYADASPARLLPHGARLLLLHGRDDRDVPISQSRAYARLAREAGDEVELVELEATGHMDFVDPRSVAHARLCEWLEEREPGSGSGS